MLSQLPRASNLFSFSKSGAFLKDFSRMNQECCNVSLQPALKSGCQSSFNSPRSDYAEPLI